VLRDGRLHARAIKDLPLDGRAFDGFLCHELDGKVLTIIGIEMRHDTNQDTGALQKLVLTVSQAFRIVADRSEQAPDRTGRSRGGSM
jgi:hypothetical protein